MFFNPSHSMGLSYFNALLKRSVKPAIRVFSSFCACSYKMVGHYHNLPCTIEQLKVIKFKR